MMDALNENTGGTILVPMITCMEEVLEIRKIFLAQLQKKGNPDELGKKIKLGLMVETPAIAIMLDKCLPYFDNFSIGTNDLVQYTLAADRNNSSVADLYTRISPAVLRIISNVVKLVKGSGKDICLCGEMVHEEKMLPILIGLGLNTFSINPQALSTLRRYAKSLNLENCRELARLALECECEKDVLALYRKIRPDAPVSVGG